ncbi:MAG: YdcF family protein [Alphaproteobacteria bacterium]|nr:YdcF family protein [Alphaproteobacteria bacterium]
MDQLDASRPLGPRLFAAFAAGAAGLWLAGFFWFAVTIPEAVVDPSTRTDAIVVLTGGSDRISTGIALLAADRADRLFISGVGANTRLSELIPPDQSALGERIAIGTAAIDTVGNALETAAWARDIGARSIRLVTAAYHMRRSLTEIRAVMPEVTIVPHPVFPVNVRSDWWNAPGTASLIAIEYSKYLVVRARITLGPSEPLEP